MTPVAFATTATSIARAQGRPLSDQAAKGKSDRPAQSEKNPRAGLRKRVGRNVALAAARKRSRSPGLPNASKSAARQRVVIKVVPRSVASPLGERRRCFCWEDARDDEQETGTTN